MVVRERKKEKESFAEVKGRGSTPHALFTSHSRADLASKQHKALELYLNGVELHIPQSDGVNEVVRKLKADKLCRRGKVKG